VELNIQPEFKELLELFTKQEVEFFIVGGYALAFHGHPRMTGDIDILVGTDLENSRKILAALKEFGLGSLGLKESDFAKREEIIQLGYSPKRIDLLTSISGVPWEQVKKNAVHYNLNGLSIDVISLEDFIKNKQAVGRPQDVADIAAVKLERNISEDTEMGF
jgi:predicted nucleotidyltransferase